MTIPEGEEARPSAQASKRQTTDKDNEDLQKEAIDASAKPCPKAELRPLHPANDLDRYSPGRNDYASDEMPEPPYDYYGTAAQPPRKEGSAQTVWGGPDARDVSRPRSYERGYLDDDKQRGVSREHRSSSLEYDRINADEDARQRRIQDYRDRTPDGWPVLVIESRSVAPERLRQQRGRERVRRQRHMHERGRPEGRPDRPQRRTRSQTPPPAPAEHQNSRRAIPTESGLVVNDESLLSEEALNQHHRLCSIGPEGCVDAAPGKKKCLPTCQLTMCWTSEPLNHSSSASGILGRHPRRGSTLVQASKERATTNSQSMSCSTRTTPRCRLIRNGRKLVIAKPLLCTTKSNVGSSLTTPFVLMPTRCFDRTIVRAKWSS